MGCDCKEEGSVRTFRVILRNPDGKILKQMSLIGTSMEDVCNQYQEQDLEDDKNTYRSAIVKVELGDDSVECARWT